jgi:DNA-binding MurR/RpiR family transcriptional regulator
LRPAAERIRQPSSHDVLDHALTVEISNVQQTLSAVEPDVLLRATQLLAEAPHIGVIAGDSGVGTSHDLVAQLGMIRPNVFLAEIGSVAVVRSLAWLKQGDVLVTIDSARYEAVVVDAVERAAASGVSIISLSDSHLSPVARRAACSFRIVDRGTGPFDSYTGALALVNLLVAATVKIIGAEVVTHLDHLEATWRDSDALRSD